MSAGADHHPLTNEERRGGEGTLDGRKGVRGGEGGGMGGKGKARELMECGENRGKQTGVGRD